MKLFNIVSETEFARLSELDAPMLGTTPAPAATTTGTGVAGATQDPQAQAKMAAQQALDRVHQKQQLQQQVKDKQAEIQQAQKDLQELQKQLASIR